MLALTVALCAIPASASAQREAWASGARVTAQDTTCWSNSQAPCEGVDRAEVEVQAGREAVLVRVVSVEVRASDGGAGWQPASGVHVLRRAELARTEPPRRTRPVVRFARGTTDTLLVFFDRVRALEGRVRVTLDVGGRRVVVEADHHVLTESPDPEF